MILGKSEFGKLRVNFVNFASEFLPLAGNKNGMQSNMKFLGPDTVEKRIIKL